MFLEIAPVLGLRVAALVAHVVHAEFEIEDAAVTAFFFAHAVGVGVDLEEPHERK